MNVRRVFHHTAAMRNIVSEIFDQISIRVVRDYSQFGTKMSADETWKAAASS